MLSNFYTTKDKKIEKASLANKKSICLPPVPPVLLLPYDYGVLTQTTEFPITFILLCTNE